MSVGPSMFLSKLSEDSGLTSSLKLTFPDTWDVILSCAMYLISETSPLSWIEPWSASHVTPCGRTITVPDIESLFSVIDDDSAEAFMRIWRKHVKDERIATVITDFSGNAHQDSSGSIVSSVAARSVHWEAAVCFGRESGIPIAFSAGFLRRKGEDLRDILFDRFYWLDRRNSIFVFDRAFSPESVVKDAISESKDYMYVLPNSIRIARDAISENSDTIVDRSNYYENPDGSHGFAVTKREPGNRPYSIHLCYSEEDNERDIGAFFSLIDMCKQELDSGVFVPEHVPVYSRFFARQGPLVSSTTDINSNKVMEYSSSAGYLLMLTDCVQTHSEARMLRRRMMECTESLSEVRNGVDSTRLRLFSPHNLESRMFLQFVAHILRSLARRVLEDNSLRREFSVRSALRELDGLMEVRGMGFKRPRVTRADYRKDMLLKAVGIRLD